MPLYSVKYLYLKWCRYLAGQNFAPHVQYKVYLNVFPRYTLKMSLFCRSQFWCQIVLGIFECIPQIIPPKCRHFAGHNFAASLYKASLDCVGGIIEDLPKLCAETFWHCADASSFWILFQYWFFFFFPFPFISGIVVVVVVVVVVVIFVWKMLWVCTKEESYYCHTLYLYVWRSPSSNYLRLLYNILTPIPR